MNCSIFLFRRDLRLEDNNAFIKCLEYIKNTDLNLIPIFHLNPDQINKSKNAYFSDKCVNFMDECLQDLEQQLNKQLNLKLYIVYGNIEEIIDKIENNYKIDSIFYNIDLTPYAIKRDKNLKNYCNKRNIKVFESEDYTLYPINSIKKNELEYYKLFTAFYNKSLESLPQKPIKYKFTKLKKIQKLKNLDLYDNNLEKFYIKEKKLLNGGRLNALKILNKINDGNFDNYKKERDYPSLDSTTKLSAYLKFGCISIREVYYTIYNKYKNKKNDLLRELIFREFYYNIVFNNQNLLQKQINKNLENEDFNENFSKIPWNNDKSLLKLWENGMTGFPLVDAGMRELNNTGFMHNRIRMLTSSFLIKQLNIDWRLGERWYMKHLIDADPIQNNQGWVSSFSGASAQPWFRIMSPWEQIRKFDKDCKYIKKWIPELKDVPSKDILNWDIKFKDYPNCKYPKPCVDHKIEREKILKKYKKYLKS